MRKSYLIPLFVLLVGLLWSFQCFGQRKDSVKAGSSAVAMAIDSILNSTPLGSKNKPSIAISGYIDVYYAYYTDSVGTGKYQKFPAISPRSNSFGFNIAQVTENFTSDRIRSTATLQFGDLPSAAWSPVFNYIQEANVGVRLAKNLWADGGFFKTHIGTESLLPKDNITSSVSLITFYEPWWQAGARLVYTTNDNKFYGAFYVVNGYNQFVATNNKKAFGLALSYNFSDYFSIGYYNFLSDDNPDSITTSHWRFLNNLVFNIGIGKKLKIIAGADYITQQNSEISNSSETAIIYSGILTVKYQFAKKFGVYGRYEEYNDRNGILSGVFLSSANELEGYQLQGGTLGVECKPIENSYIRLEGRVLNSQNDLKIFRTDGNNVGNRAEVMLNMGVWF